MTTNISFKVKLKVYRSKDFCEIILILSYETPNKKTLVTIVEYLAVPPMKHKEVPRAFLVSQINIITGIKIFTHLLNHVWTNLRSLSGLPSFLPLSDR